MVQTTKKALIAGATGLVGKALVNLLLEKEYYEEIVILSRRELAVDDERLKVVIVSDFDKLEEHQSALNVEDVYCSLGTTRKKAGSKEAFLKVDVDYPMKLAELTKDQPRFQQFLLVSSLGANADSPLFYNETKGKLEQALEDLEMNGLKIFQPSLLLGKREEFRLLEEVGKAVSALLSFFVVGSKKRLWSIKDEEVAYAMYQVAKQEQSGVERFKPNDMLKMMYVWS